MTNKAKIIQLWEGGLKDYKQIAHAVGCPVHSVRARVSEARTAAAHVIEFPLQEPPEAQGNYYDAYPVYIQDEALVFGDVHTPTHNAAGIKRLCEFARMHLDAPRVGFNVGDFMNGDTDSVHDPNGDEPSRRDELRLVAEVLHYMLDTFDMLVLTPGNHLRKRFYKTLRSDIDPDQMVRLITLGDDWRRIQLLNHDIVGIESGNERWTATHQYQYRRVKLSLADELAQRYQTNIITFHQHHSAVGRDRYDRYTIIDCGGLHDHTRMSYVHLVPSARNVPNSGFVYLKNGCGQLLTPYRTMTQWGLWGMEDVA